MFSSSTNYIKVRFEGPQKRWTIFKDKYEYKTHDTKKDAVREARRIAKANKPSQLIINKKNGELSEVQSYGK